MFLIFGYTGVTRFSRLTKIRAFSMYSSCVVCGFLSLGGLPPFGGFLIKFIPIYLRSTGGGYLVLVPLIVGALLSLFFYLRVVVKVGLLVFPVSCGSLIRSRVGGHIPWLWSLSLK